MDVVGGRKIKEEEYFMTQENYVKLKFLSVNSFIGQQSCQLVTERQWLLSGLSG